MARLARKAAFTALWSVFRANHRGGATLGQRVLAIPRMLLATVTGRYDGKGRVFAMLIATAYIISPIDLVPEAIFLAFGLIDDSFVVAWLAGALLSETDRYLEWERRSRYSTAGTDRRRVAD